MMTRFRWPIVSVLLALALLAVLSMGQTFPRNPLGWAIAQRLTVNTISTLTGAVTTGGSITVGDDATVTDQLNTADLTTSDDATVGDDLLVGGHLRFTPQSVITVTNNSVITPTGELQYLTSAATRGTRLVVTTTLEAGTIQIFRIATGSSGVTLTDTAPLCLAGNAVLTAGDTLGLLHNGVCWEQLFKNDNG